MSSIRELRNRKRRESFTGRDGELHLFRQLLAAEEPEYALFHIYGVGGIGKSSLLNQFRRIAQGASCPVAMIDMQVNFGVIEVLTSIRDQVAPTPSRDFSEFDRALDMYNDVQSKLQSAVGSLSSGIISGIREGIPLGLGALAVDTIGEEQVKAWLYRHLPRANADLYLHGDRVLTEKLILGLNALTAHSKIVLLFDTYEQTSQAQDDWLCDTLLDSNLSNQTLIAIAGRDPLGGRWSEWDSVMLNLELQRFTEQEAREYLVMRGVSDLAMIDELLVFTQRFPWALALVTDTPALRQMSAADLAAQRHTIGDKLAERFVSQVIDEPEMRELVELCAVVRTFDYDVVRAMWQRQDVEEPMRRLRHYSFVTVRQDGRWSLHQIVRGFLNQGLKRRSLSHWGELNQRAADFYATRTTQWPRYSEEWNWMTLEHLYHQLRLDEEQGVLTFARLFEEAKRFSRYDFCSELLNNVQDVELSRPHSHNWFAFYRGKMIRIIDTFAWDKAHSINLRLYQESDLPAALRAHVTTDLGRYYYHLSGEYEQAIQMLEESLRLRSELDDRQGQAHVLSHLAMAYAAAGDYERGRESGLACIRLAEELDAPFRLGWGCFSLGVLETHAGNHETAIEHFKRSLATFKGTGYEFEPGVVRHRLGRVSLAMGDYTGALEHYRASLELMRKYEKRAWATRTLIDMCEVYRLQGNVPHFERHAAEAEAIALDQHNDTQLARLRLLQAETALETGQSEEAIATLYLEGLFYAANAPRIMLQASLAQIERGLAQLTAEPGRANKIKKQLLSKIEQALDDSSIYVNLPVRLGPRGRETLRALDLPRHWCIDQGG